MDLIEELAYYHTLNNYIALWDLAQKNSIICILDYQILCKTIACISGDKITISIKNESGSYIESDNDEDFQEKCQNHNLVWFLPADYDPVVFLSSWTCMICGKRRPDAKISVFTTDISEERGFSPGSMKQNVRYCNDNSDCTEKAKTKRLF